MLNKFVTFWKKLTQSKTVLEIKKRKNMRVNIFFDNEFIGHLLKSLFLIKAKTYKKVKNELHPSTNTKAPNSEKESGKFYYKYYPHENRRIVCIPSCLYMNLKLFLFLFTLFFQQIFDVRSLFVYQLLEPLNDHFLGGSCGAPIQKNSGNLKRHG